MNCKDTQKKQYANFYFIFLLFSFRQILITRPYCHFPTLFFSPSSTSQPFTQSLPPFSHLFSHAPNPLSHCLSPQYPLLFFPTSIVFLPDFHSFALQSLFPPIPTSVFPLSNLQCTTLFPIPTFRVTFPFPTCPDSPLVVTFFPSFWPSNSSSPQLHHSFAHRSL